MNREKIKPTHLARSAYVYIRQSSMYQVRHNHESRRRQYELDVHAHSLGFQQVVVIDEDLGLSGSGAKDRPGFGRLVAAVCEGAVGAVFALEASRLARNNRDWHHLIDLCAVTSTLVVDTDGIYDPRILNDRLVLGLKGTMSEFELGLMRQRAQEAMRQKIHRGEVLCHPAVGYIRTDDNRMEMTPDRQVQEALRGLFAKFVELGSARQVMLWYQRERIPMPTWRTVEGPTKEIVWKLPPHNRVLSILKNPVYAGAFVHGRHQVQTEVVGGRARRTSSRLVPREQWEVLILDHHPGYITWSQYLQNQELLMANDGMHSQTTRRAAKRGPALLTGLLRCRRCGGRLHVRYSGYLGRIHRYCCFNGLVQQGADPCISFGGVRVDLAVEKVMLETLQPISIEASLAAASRVEHQEDEKRSAIRLALQKAQYEARRIERQYNAADPENRLVAAELESRWNQALQRVTELENRLAEAQETEPALVEADRRRLLELGEDLEEAWHHPQAPVTLKKRILKAVLQEIVVDVLDEPPQIHLRLHWSGGVHTELRVPKCRRGEHRRTTDREVVDLIRELAKVCRDAEIARILNRSGYRTGGEKTWTSSRIRSHRASYDIPVFDDNAERSWLMLAEVARELGITPLSVRKLLKCGVLSGNQLVAHAPWVIQRSDVMLPEVQAAARAVRAGTRGPRRAAKLNEHPLFTDM